MASSPAALQLMFDVAWVIARLHRWDIRVKGITKTAAMLTYWDGQVQRDVEGVQIRMPDGTRVPQIPITRLSRTRRGVWTNDECHAAQVRARMPDLNGETTDEEESHEGTDHTVATARIDTASIAYRYLGAMIMAGWSNGQELTRDEVRRTLIKMIKMVGHLPMLTCGQMHSVIDMVISGVVGYYGRATVMRQADADAIEAARTDAAVRNRGFERGERATVYGTREGGGMGACHAYQECAAVYIDQIDRAITMSEGVPVRVAVASAIAVTCWRLGCRTRSPIEWHPTHLERALDENMMIEAWVLAKLRAGMMGVRTGRQESGPLTDETWTVTDDEFPVPPLCINLH